MPTETTQATTYYGVIFGDEVSFRGPRVIDGDECDSLQQAFAKAIDGIVNGQQTEAEIVQCKLYGPDGDGYWGEIPGAGSIRINAEDAAHWFPDPYAE